MINNKFPLVCVMCLVCGCAGGNSGSDLNVGDIGDVSDITDVAAVDATDSASHDGTVTPDAVSDDTVVDVDVPDSDLPDSIDTGDLDVAEDVPDMDGVVDVGDIADVKVDWTCPTYGAPAVVGNLDNTSVFEASGLAASRKHPGVLWTHKDSQNDGDKVNRYVYAVMTATPEALLEVGSVVYELTLKDVSFADLEDIAIGPFAAFEGDAVFLADTGNNSSSRDVLSVYVFAEPDAVATAEIDNVARINVRYPDGRHDCESFFVDPLTGDLYFVVKEYTLEVTKVYMMPAPAADFSTGEVPVELTYVGEFPFMTATGADMSLDGLKLVVRGYFGGLYFQREQGQSIADMLVGKTCELPLFSQDPYNEPQGEAIALDPDGNGFYTVSERILYPQDIHFTPLNP